MSQRKHFSIVGLALLHHMTYMESKETFGQAAEVDPDCAIAYWGAAMTHVHPLWPDAISAAQLEAGQTLLDRAATAAHASERERAYIAALDAAISGRCGRSSVPWGACSWLCVGPRLKDRFLEEHLDGYAAYRERVRYRLVPGVW